LWPYWYSQQLLESIIDMAAQLERVRAMEASGKLESIAEVN
jgi:hypothetical protein